MSNKDPIVNSVISDLINRYSDNIIAIYGIGSYFDDSLPPNWVKNDLDMVVVVKILEEIPKEDWTEVRYEKREINGTQVWLGFNTLEVYQDRDKFTKESFSNYEWALIDLKHPENSILLYGEDISSKLPDTKNLKFDYNDVLSRALYHLEKSLKERKSNRAIKELTKGIFKLGFYICIYVDPLFRLTTIMGIGTKLQKLSRENHFIKKSLTFYEKAIISRITGNTIDDLGELRLQVINYIFKLSNNGVLHKKMNYTEFKKYLSQSFNGFPFLIHELKEKIVFKK